MNPKFDLRDDAAGLEDDRISGYATPEGTKAYAERSAVVHSSNFKKVQMVEEDENLTLSKMTYGTESGRMSTSARDFLSYMAVRTALLSGGINHIDTGNFFMGQRAEPVIGGALRTMFRKFNMSREEVFVNSKQGWLLGNVAEDVTAELMLKELLLSTNLQEEDFISEGKDQATYYYSMAPEFLNFSLDYSLEKLGLQTLDAVLLT